jgi:tetratricopeptide (TPR) repeat protein
MDAWYDTGWREKPHWAQTIQAGREGSPDAAPRLTALAMDASVPAIVRATAVTLLRTRAQASTLIAVRAAAEDPDPMVRRAALEALEGFPPADRLRYGLPRLGDPVRSVRCAAVPVLATVPAAMVTAPQRAALMTGVEEYVASELANADRGGAHLNLGVLYTYLRQPRKAEEAYRTAIRVEPRFAQAYVNLADLYRTQGREEEGERVLREAVAHNPGLAATHHALGLLLIRRGQSEEAFRALERAARLGPESPRFGYVYAVALESRGELTRAVEVLERVHRRHPEDREVLTALIAYHRQGRRLDRAIRFAEKLLTLNPQDATTRRNLERLRREAHLSR